MRKYLTWIMLLLLVLITFGTIYAMASQIQRAAANYPQVQLAQDTARALNRGDDPFLYIAGDVDMKNSLAPFTIIYDKKGKVVAGSGKLDGKTPKAPLGILQAAKGQSYHTVTWEPQPNIRMAAVTAETKNYYVLSGRSLKEVEKNKTRVSQLVLIGGLLSVILMAGTFVLTAARSEY